MRTQLFSSQWLPHLLLQQQWLQSSGSVSTMFLSLCLYLPALFLIGKACNSNPFIFCLPLCLYPLPRLRFHYVFLFLSPLQPLPASAQPDELTNVLEICNIVFTSMFTLEMILKLTAFGFFEYLRNPYNIFDGIIVIIRSVTSWNLIMN